MNWLTWRQYRVEAFIGAFMLVLLSVWLIFDGLVQRGVSSILDGGTICLASCSSPRVELELFGEGIALNVIPFWLPLLIAVFIGVPLVARECESRGNYLAWTQSITRTRWLAVKLSWVGGITLLAFLVICAFNTWSSAPEQARAMGTAYHTYLSWGLYDYTGFVPIGLACFGLMLGVALGTMLRRTLPAMALTLLLFLLFNQMMHVVYPYLIPPQSQVFPATFGANLERGSLELYDRYVDSQGRETQGFNGYCVSPLVGNQCGSELQALMAYCGSRAVDQCVQDHHLRLEAIYQPPERFWLLQAAETGLLLALAAVLVPFTFWWLRKRIC